MLIVKLSYNNNKGMEKEHSKLEQKNVLRKV
jgi:hypothetical protein